MFVSLFLAAAVGAGVNSGISSINNDDKDVIEPYVTPFSASVSLESINDMNIILNDCDCSNTLFTDIVDILENDGLNITTTSDCNDINNDNCTVITLDQQYSAGESTLIFAPFNNTRLGHSDSLAIAMKSAFDQNGFLVEDILCSQVGYSMNDDGTISSYVPTMSEAAIDDEKDVSFVTISFGTHNVNAAWVAKSIENGLARQKYYLDNYDSQTDLIYHASGDDTLENVALYFDTDKASLIAYNNLQSEDLMDSQAIVNSNTKDYDVFNRDSNFLIDGNKTKAY